VESVPWFPYSDVPPRSPRAPSYAGLQQRAAFANWLQSLREERGVSRKQLARALWGTNSADTTTARIKRYETVVPDALGRPKRVMLPSPQTLRRICRELNVSWLTGFANAGYYHELLQVLAALVGLAWQWLDEDAAFAREGARQSFRSAGVTALGGQIVWEALQQPRYADRYIEGMITQAPLPRAEPTVRPGNDIPEHVLRLMEEDQGPRQWGYVVPKPMAVAVLVVTTGFPRRGDIWKKGVDMYAVHLFEAITPMAELALKSASVELKDNIQRADEALADLRLSIDGRRVVAAEYLLAWADAFCQGYTHYARLASLEYFGLAGVSIDKMTPEIQLPQIRRARLPDVSVFRMTQ
jgi:transcriptional regulator with XRE-family HTH domain